MKMEKVGRVLYISGTPLVPPKLGPARRNHHIIGQLCRFYDVTLLSIGTEADARAFAASGGGVRSAWFVPQPSRPWRVARKLFHTAAGRCDLLAPWEPRFRRACAHLASGEPFDAIFLSHALLRRLPLPGDVPIVGDTHNVEFDLMRRIAERGGHALRRYYARRQSEITQAEERACAARVDLLLATSDRDRRVFEEELGVRHVEVIPNGIDLAEFQPAARAGEEPVVLFTGLMSYYPNQQGVRWFLDEVLPRVRRRVPAARLIVAGAAPPRWLRRRAGRAIEVTGGVADMRPYLARAAVVVVPLTIGGGTRVKILEAMATATPVVSTSIGAEGLSLRDGEALLIADDAETFARQVVKALTEPALRARLTAAGRAHVVSRFDWDRIGERLARVLHARIGLAPAREAASLKAAAR